MRAQKKTRDKPTVSAEQRKAKRAAEVKQTQKPRRHIIRGRGKVGYAIGSTKLRGLHRFLDELLLPIERFTADGLRWFNGKRPESLLPIAAIENQSAEDSKRGPMPTIFAAGIRLDRAVRAAIRESKLPRKKQKKDYSTTWAGTVLALVQNALRVKPTQSQLLCASERGRVGTEIDFIGKDEEDALVVFELKSTTGEFYSIEGKYAWHPRFIALCQQARVELPRILLSQCERDLLQALCGRILYEEYTRTWASRLHKRGARMRTPIVIRSPAPALAEAYAVPKWMSDISEQILAYMCATAPRD